MITIQDLYNILGNKISNEMQKAISKKGNWRRIQFVRNPY